LMRRFCRGSRTFTVATQPTTSSSSQTIIDKEFQHSAHKYVFFFSFIAKDNIFVSGFLLFSHNLIIHHVKLTFIC
jgi:hypothetical protein